MHPSDSFDGPESIRAILEQNYLGLRQAVVEVESSLPALGRCAQLLAEALAAGHQLLTAGNGGSAADALHLAEELVGRYQTDRRALPAISLVADGTALTCIGNDYGFEQIFSRQIEALGRPGDVLVLFSTSGNSPNLLRALVAAREQGMQTVALLGRGGGLLQGRADAEWVVPTGSGARTQELHGWALHLLLEVIEARLFP